MPEGVYPPLVRNVYKIGEVGIKAILAIWSLDQAS